MKKTFLTLWALTLVGFYAVLNLTSTPLKAVDINLIPNYSLESGTTTLPTSWNKGGWGTNTATLSYISTGAQDGQKAAKIAITKYTSGDRKWYSNDITVKPNTKYTFSNYYKSTVATEVDIRYTTTNNAQTYVSILNPAVATNWTKATTTFTTPANVKSLTIFHLIAKKGELTVDNFSLTEVLSGSPTPTVSPTPSATPTRSPSPTPNASSVPTSVPTVAPTSIPTVAPTSVPTSVPTVVPTTVPTVAPTSVPTVAPSSTPANTSTPAPTAAPTSIPTTVPTVAPTTVPTVAPTSVPTSAPSSTPAPTVVPTVVPTIAPTSVPTTVPTVAPTTVPTVAPTTVPTVAPTAVPTTVPTSAPTVAPSSIPTSIPTVSPTPAVSPTPSAAPSPTVTPTPSASPSPTPTPTPTGLILNPSVEIANGADPTSWNRGGWGTNTAVFTYPAEASDGTKGIKVELTSFTNGDAKWYFNEVPVTPGGSYTFSHDYKSNIASELTAQYRHTNGTVTYAWLADIPASPTNWTTTTQNINIPADVTSFTIFHNIFAVGWLVTDNFKLFATPSNKFAQGMVSLNFDDGYLSVYQNAIPMLNSAGIKSTQYIISETLAGGYSDYVNTSQVLAMQAAGHEIGAHSVSHPDLTLLTQAQMQAEIVNSKTALQNAGVTNVKSFAYPYGNYNSTVIQEVINAGYTSARTAYPDGENYKNTDKYQLQMIDVQLATPLATVQSWIDQAVANKSWVILIFHQIDNLGDQYSTTPARLQQIVDYINAKGVMTVTNSQGVALMN